MQRSKTNQKTGAGMCQDQVIKEVKVDVGVEVFLDPGDFHHHPGWTCGCWILMLYSLKFEYSLATGKAISYINYT